MFVTDSNWIGIAESPTISKEYLEDIKARSRVNPQRDEPPYMQISTKLYSKISRFPYKSVVTRKVLDYIMMATWGMAGKTDKRDLEKVCLSMSLEYMAKQLGCKRIALINALKELKNAKILLVQNNKGKMKGSKRYPNYYFINKHYDTWVYPKGMVDNSIVDNSIVDNSIVEHTIQYNENDLELGVTTAFPHNPATMVRYLELCDKKTINEIAIMVTGEIRSQDILGSNLATVERYEGWMFGEIGKLRGNNHKGDYDNE